MTASMAPEKFKLKTANRYLNDEQLEQFGQEIEAVRQRIMETVGEKDAAYIRRVIRWQRGLEIIGRGSLFLGVLPPFWLLGTAALSVAKILENMEIGHNVMHAQWDWLRDPAINSASWDWDNVCPAEEWKHSHNYLHHKWTNVVGMDRDVGYGILRMSELQSWNPYYLFQPVSNALLAIFFQWGVALHDLEVDRVLKGEKSWAEVRRQWRGIRQKMGKQVLKDYVLFPLLAGPFFLPVLLGNMTANLIRNLWAYAIIFCGHFPDGVEEFLPEDVENESRGHWYLRQLLGSANITGGPLFHIMSGNLSHQIEHHLFPDMPSNRYAQAAQEVQAICRKYNLPYNARSFGKQFGSVLTKVMRLSLPNRRRRQNALASA